MRNRSKTIGAFVLFIVLFYLLLWPVPIDPVAWEAPKDAGLVGDFQANTVLGKIQKFGLEGDIGPEHIEVGPDGWAYTGLLSGDICRFRILPDGQVEKETYANTGGRPLGLAFDTEGNLWVADATLGLMKVDKNRQSSVVVDNVDGIRLGLADAVVVAHNGLIYFTDASSKFPAKDVGGTFASSLLEILEQRGTGRLIEYNPTTKKSKVIGKDWVFPNGLVFDALQESVFVAETGRFRIFRVWIAGPNKGTTTEFLSNLPGFPDNLSKGLDGRYWIGFTKPRGAAAEALWTLPFIRKLVFRLPSVFLPIPPEYGHIAAFNEKGEITQSYQDPEGHYPETSGVAETKDYFFVHSLIAPDVGYLSKDAIPKN